MGKQKTCSKCSQEIHDSNKEKTERFTVMKMLSMIKLAGLDEIKKETESYCYKCWKTRLRSVMKPFAQALGTAAGDW
jgi:hypothetical protein